MVKTEQYIKDAKKIDFLNDELDHDKTEMVKRAKMYLSMYSEDGTSFYDDLHIEDDEPTPRGTTPKQIRANARKNIRQLQTYIKKYE